MVFGRAPHQKICNYSGNSVYHSGRAFPCLPTGRTAIPRPIPGAIASSGFPFQSLTQIDSAFQQKRQRLCR